MANRKKEVYKPKPMTEGKRNIIQGLLQEYDIETAEDIQDALKDLLSGTVKEMLEAEMDDHLGYGKYERSEEDNLCGDGWPAVYPVYCPDTIFPGQKHHECGRMVQEPQYAGSYR